MRRQLAITLAALLSAAASVCGTPAPLIYEGRLNLQGKPMDQGGRAQWDVGAKVANTGRVRLYTFAGTNVFNPTGYTVTFNAGPSRDDAGHIALATSSNTATYVEFTFATNTLGYAFDKWYSAVKLVSGGTVVSSPEGLLSCSKAPEVDGGSVTFTYSIDWALYDFLHGLASGPYRAGTNIVAATNADGSVTFNVDSAVSSGDITGVSITAGFGMTGTATTASGQHTQTLGMDATRSNVVVRAVTNLTGDTEAVVSGTGHTRALTIGAGIARDTETAAATGALVRVVLAVPTTSGPTNGASWSTSGQSRTLLLQFAANPWLTVSGLYVRVAQLGTAAYSNGSQFASSGHGHGLGTAAYSNAAAFAPAGTYATLAQHTDHTNDALNAGAHLITGDVNFNTFSPTNVAGITMTDGTRFYSALGGPLFSDGVSGSAIIYGGNTNTLEPIFLTLAKHTDHTNDTLATGAHGGTGQLATVFYPLNGNPSDYLQNNGAPFAKASLTTTWGPNAAGCVGYGISGNVDAKASLVIGENMSFTGHHSLVAGSQLHIGGSGSGNQLVALGRNITIPECIEDYFIWNDGTYPITTWPAVAGQNSAVFSASGGVHVLHGPVTSNGVPYALKTDITAATWVPDAAHATNATAATYAGIAGTASNSTTAGWAYRAAAASNLVGQAANINANSHAVSNVTQIVFVGQLGTNLFAKHVWLAGTNYFGLWMDGHATNLYPVKL